MIIIDKDWESREEAKRLEPLEDVDLVVLDDTIPDFVYREAAIDDAKRLLREVEDNG